MNRLLREWLDGRAQTWIRKIYEEYPDRAVVVLEGDRPDADLTRSLHDELARVRYARIPDRYHGKPVVRLDDAGLDVQVRRSPFTSDPLMSDDPWNELPEDRFLFLLFMQERGDIESRAPVPARKLYLKAMQAEPLGDEWTESWLAYERARKPTVRRTADNDALDRARNRMYWQEAGGDAQRPFAPEEVATSRPAVNQDVLARFREVLSAGYGDGDITTLVFDNFYPLYGDFSGGMTKSDKVARLVEYAVQNGRLGDLLVAMLKSNSHQGRILLRDAIIARFDDAELRSFIQGLRDCDYENLPGSGKASKVRELVAYMERRGRTTELAQAFVKYL